MGWLGLVWARDSGLTEVVGQPECLDLAPVCAQRGGECELRYKLLLTVPGESFSSSSAVRQGSRTGFFTF